ncbi:hypothetical protein D1007_26350 [Hordeum vulgare]|nr:hypothetical protein D1007_26350 [Hordeum vulgare]
MSTRASMAWSTSRSAGRLRTPRREKYWRSSCGGGAGALRRRPPRDARSSAAESDTAPWSVAQTRGRWRSSGSVRLNGHSRMDNLNACRRSPPTAGAASSTTCTTIDILPDSSSSAAGAAAYMADPSASAMAAFLEVALLLVVTNATGLTGRPLTM